MNKDKVLVIVGPTAVGKTALSIQLAKEFNGEVISGDSLQVYRTLDIGTAKAGYEERSGIPHHLIDIIEPEASYTVSDFKQSAEKIIQNLSSEKKVPIICGGTGMYIQSLLFDFQLGKKDSQHLDMSVREKWEKFLVNQGKIKLWKELAEIDKAAALAIHPNNIKRVIRALEVYETTGSSILNQQEIDFKDLTQSQYDCKVVGLMTERSLLYERINKRVDLMMEMGLLAEAKMVYNLGDVQAKQGIGYKEFYPYFTGEMSLESAVEKVKQHSRQYAKRQMTWFRNRMTVEWFDVIQYPEQQIVIRDDIKKWLFN
ncbi:tRNA (adenosine(37)-N6)-dimethylallyltransferase MiaA [Vagococcus vulneris]|uniref:tRNA dimethylallyltransferase n=1 Tax=Vagococcus vulneris TaxID=1977869 RepID=A0A429ZZM1_9ENTE|nr:tRNA (adenosine(37)-N6)-dimethylallyltransferase MiaA [Vagococcus vulneris]RST99502.1 tRNA (adenosine(37)-N6)-dimethylallyltransferase MiaA [Vagococcus vulneris]